MKKGIMYSHRWCFAAYAPPAGMTVQRFRLYCFAQPWFRVCPDLFGEHSYSCRRLHAASQECYEVAAMHLRVEHMQGTGNGRQVDHNVGQAWL